MSFTPIKYRSKLPKISDKALIAPNAIISGDTEIMENTNIWYNVVIRGDVAPIRIGKNTNIQDGTIIPVTRPNHPQNKTNENGRAGWATGIRLSPKNFGEHNVMTWDGFLTLEDAMNHWANWVESKKDYEKIALPNGFDLKMLAQKIAETTAPSN